MSERIEIADTVEAVRREIEDLVVRGLRTAGPSDLARLSSMRDELQRVGAGHMAGRITELLERTRADDREAAGALMKTLSSLRVFERLLTLDTLALALERPDLNEAPNAAIDDDEELDA